MLKPDGPDRFRVDFAELRREGGWKRLFGRGPVVVDAFALARAVIGALQSCPFRSATGAPQVWNEYRIFLSREDHDRLRPVESTLHRDLMPMLYEELVRLNAVTVGSLTIRLLVDDTDDVSVGTAILHVRHSPEVEAAVGKGEITVRLDKANPGSVAPTLAPPGGLPTLIPDSVPPVEYTERIGQTVAILRANGQNIPLQPGVRYVAGRGFPDAPADHLALPGAGAKINRRQLSIRMSDDLVEIGREPGGSNPVMVAGTPLAPGQVVVTRLPVDIVLSGDLRVDIVSPGGPDPVTLSPC
jgi:hypothetical protein